MILVHQAWFLTPIHVPLEESASHPLSLTEGVPQVQIQILEFQA